MKRFLLFLILILFGTYLWSQNSIETSKINNLNIIKPTIPNLIRITKMEFSDFENQIKQLGYQKVGVDADMVKYRTGTPLNTSGVFEISKSQYRTMISILWVAGDRQKTIFDDLANQLKPFFKEVDGNDIVFQFDTTTGEVYQVVLNRETGSELLFFIRIK